MKRCLATLAWTIGAAVLFGEPAAAQQHFPDGVLFEPLLADPKQTRSYLSLQHYDIDVRGAFTAAAVAFGETFGILGSLPRNGAPQWQLNLDGAVFAQFDMDSSSMDLLNADYRVGFVVERTSGHLASRWRLYHQSTHLGDELLLRDPDLAEQRVNFSYESLQFLQAYRQGAWRVYGGGEYLLRRDPADLEPLGAQLGVEFHGRREVIGSGRLVGGLDVRSFQHLDWDTGLSIMLGLEFGDPAPSTRRRLRALLEAYRGFVPFGQFYDASLTSYGIGIHIGL